MLIHSFSRFMPPQAGDAAGSCRPVDMQHVTLTLLLLLLLPPAPQHSQLQTAAAAAAGAACKRF
jgi:hypothetical protein